MSVTLDKPGMVQLLSTNDNAVIRALMVLHDRQTHDEQSSHATRHLNGRGFKPCHARMGSSMAKFAQRTGFLTPKQLAYWRRPDASGSPRIACYWAQLAEAAKEKAAKKALDNTTSASYAEHTMASGASNKAYPATATL